MRRAAICLVFVVGSAAAQNATDSKPQEKPAERPRLNLKLDNPSSFARIAPPEEKEKEQAKEVLPGLGDGARRLPSAPSGERGSPFPKDSNPAK